MALQYRWIQRLAEAERVQLASGLEAVAERFVEASGRDLVQLYLAFQVDGGNCHRAASEKLRSWRLGASDAALVRAAYCLRPTPDGWSSRALDGSPLAGQLAPEIALELGFEPAASFPIGESFHPGIPALVVPAVPVVDAIPGGEGAANSSVVGGDFVVLLLDEVAVHQRWLPALFAAAAGGEAYEYRLRRRRGAVVAHGSPWVPTQRPPDFSTAVFSLSRSLSDRPDASPAAGSKVTRRALVVRGEGPSPWVLDLWLRRGPVEQLVASTLNRNLFLAAFILGLLAVSVVLMWRTTRRSRELARRQLDFVAGVSHELRTPLAVITSAGQNLRDGLIDDPEQGRRYGQAILREGRRLERFVEQVLSYAGALASERRYSPVPTDARALLRRSLEVCAVLDHAIVDAVENPMVLVDPDAVGAALEGLIDNAVKYGRGDNWLRVVQSRLGDRLKVVLEDRGPGLRRDEIGGLFEPFVRGSGARQQGVRGSGLGLGLARQAIVGQGGSLALRAAVPQGLVCEILLPLAAEEAQ